MKQEQPYRIKTIDLQNIDNVETLHKELARVLNFPDFYANNWDAYWDAITGLVKMPTNFIIYNEYSFYKKHEKDAEIFGTLCYKFNELNKEETIQTDVLDGLILGRPVDSIKCIFETRPFQFGLSVGSPVLELNRSIIFL